MDRRTTIHLLTAAGPGADHLVIVKVLTSEPGI